MNIGSNCRQAIATVIAGAFGITSMCIALDVRREVSHYSSSSAVDQITDGGARQATPASMVHCLSSLRHDCTPISEAIGRDENLGSDDSPASQPSSDASKQSTSARTSQQDDKSKRVVAAYTIRFVTWED